MRKKTGENIRRVVKRLVSFLIVFAVLMEMFPLFEFSGKNQNSKIQNSNNPFVLSVQAAEVDDETDERFMANKDANGYRNITIYPGILVDYSEHCQMYPYYHQFDNLTITTTGNENQNIFHYGFKGLGTDTYPFGGSISIGANQNITLNIDAPLFNAVYDSVTMTDSNNGGILRVSREFDLDQTQIKASNEGLPFIAKIIKHNSNSSSATWNISVVKPSAGDNPYLANFGGFIGSMDEDASIAINLDMNATQADSGLITMTGVDDSDIGVLCGHMGTNSELTFSLIASRGVNSVSTAYGNAGGLVGSMDSGAVLYYTGTNIQSANTDVKTTAGDSYAGGIVGYNNGGTVSITLPSGVTAYPVAQNIEGTAGAGGLYGYYKPGAIDTGNNTINALNSGINTGKYSIACQVNGTGYDGGLFGVFESENNYAVTGTATITSNHNSGSAVGYGGLIGRYNNDGLTEKLEIGAVMATSTNSASASYYGGAIAFVGDSITDGSTDGGAVYVKFDGLTVSATGADSMTFGGLSAKADNAFIDANNVTIGVTGEHKFKGGAVVGSIASGVLRMTGYTDITNTYANLLSYESGQIVGYRDNALIFATDNWTLKRGAAVAADDIGSWGEVIRFNTKTETEEDDIVTSTAYGFDDSDDETDDTVVTINETEHYAVVSAPVYDEDDSNIIYVETVSDFAKAALNMQINDSGNSGDGVLWFDETSNTSSSLLGMDIKLGNDIVLSGTGLGGFTRDNDKTDSLEAEKCVYTGTFDGDGHSITLAIGEPYGKRGTTAVTDHSVNGNGKIYNHKYIGLFGITNTSTGVTTAQNVTLKGTIDVSSVKVSNEDIRNAYVGAIAGRAKSCFNVENISMTDTVTNNVHETVFSASGSGHTYVGGLLGQASAEIEDISISNCNAKCNIQTSNINADSCFGGIIGWIAYTENASRNWNFENVNVSGEINNTHARGSNKEGGLIACISDTSTASKSNRQLNLTSVKTDGLTVKSVGDGDSTMGGALGYAWQNVNVVFHNVQVKNTTVNMTTGNGTFGGLVYQGTGYWKVEPCSAEITDEETGESSTEYYDGIKIDGLTAINSNAKSFGIILHGTKTTNTALYLEILADDTTHNVKSYNIVSADFTNLKNGCLFDEIAAYTASTDVGSNGQAVISIHSTSFKTVGGSTPSGTYAAQTARGAVPNPNTRYYYNLDSIRTASSSPDLLMRWALRQYAHSSIKSYFTYGTGFSDNKIPSGTYNMENYSWYPVDISETVTVNGTFTFYNSEFETSEQVKANAETNPYKRTSLYDSNNGSFTQHKYMHASLFRNVTGTLNVGTITLKGNVGQIRNSSGVLESGALICGKVKGTNASTIAKLNVTGGITLSGVYVNGFDTTGGTDSYAPLLVNSIQEYSNSLIKGVKTESYSDDFKAGSSLIGDVGDTDASKITLTFQDMKLDGRSTDKSGSYGLNDVYGTKSSIFTRASFLNSFKYNSGSSGVYEFDLSDDWTQSGSEGSYTYSRTSSQGVTYGSEISDSTERNQYYGKEFWYKDTQNGIYTNYSQPTASGTGNTTVNFSGFLPYVYDASTKANVSTQKKYQIKVNHADTEMTGCGTYNDPYIITSGDDLNNIAKILNGDCSNQKIALPNVYDPASSTNSNFDLLKNKKWDDFGHTDFSYDSTNTNFKNGNNKTYSVVQVQTYLAGAYYKIEEGTDIELPSDFLGLGNTETTAAFFRGIIVGNNETITLKGSNPLIHTSYGSVIRNIQIVVDADVSVTGIKADFKEKDGCGAYGAVIGQALGGDNIIDNVSVGFSDSATITVGGNKPNLAAVGGYVGVITYGSLIFRNMSREESHASDIQGIPSNSTIVTDGSNTDLISDTNKKWLYVNPIVGRVINAAVFTESTAYRPFETGSRTYIGDGGTTTTYDWTDGAVTMKNGTKNYSIADLKKPTAADMSDRLYVSNYSSTNSTAYTTYKASVNIPDAQSLFILSLLTQSKMTSTYYAHNNNKTARYCNQAGEGGYAGYYIESNGSNSNGPSGKEFISSFKTTHLADYNHVGSSDADAAADCATATLDTYTPSTNSDPDSLVPYFVKNYTKPQTVSPTEGSYSVFAISNGGTVSYMTWGGTSGSTWYMPDGFRGLGCIFKMDGYINDATLSVNKLEGNNHVIDLNMSLFHYDSDSENYLPDNTSSSNPNTYNIACSGFGLFDTLRSNRYGRGQRDGIYDSNNKIKDFTITGSVKYHVYTTSGIEINDYNKSITDNKYYSSVGALIGRLDPATSVNHQSCVLLLDNVDLSHIKIEGVYRTGGMIGCVFGCSTNATRQAYQHVYINDCSVDNANVTSVLYAGGLIGFNRLYALEITNSNIDEPNVVITLPFKNKNQANNAVGGIVGYVINSNNNSQVHLYNVSVGEESPGQNYSAYIGYVEPEGSYPTNNGNEVIQAGGLIGRTATPNSSNNDFKTLIEQCKVYNVDVYGHYSGGVIGQSIDSNNTVCVQDTVVKNSKSCKIYGNRLSNDSKGAGGIVGTTAGKSFVVNNCLIDSYTIHSIQSTGGVIGYAGATKNEIDNTEVKGIRMISNTMVGGLVGKLNNPLYGYNILTDDVRFTPFTSGQSYATGNSTSGNLRGHIVGHNNSAKLIKIAGFSRNNLSASYDCGSERMVGNYLDTSTSRYGTGGYVIFADYYNTYSNLYKGTTASTVNDDNNVTVNTYRIDTKAEEDNIFPYVNVNPQRAIENIGDNKFLTGDAIAALSYDSSVFKRIISDRNQNKLGAYTNFNTLTEVQISAISSQFSTSSLQVSGTGAPNIPLLVIEDTDYDNITKIINNYINVLANTKNYNYAEDNSIHKISLNKCVYDRNDGYTIYADGTACLKRSSINNNWVFRMTASNVDNATEGVLQFSLLDVQFLNPSNTDEVAYHLYIPVYVKKLLQYDFKAAIISNTEYYTSAYGTLNGNSLFENLGNPVTLKFEYKYTRTESEWIDAINGGENVLSNLYKTIDVDAEAWPSGTRLVLVDANNNDKNYYLDNPSAGTGVLNLRDFTDENGHNYNPAPLNSLMTVAVGQPGTGTKNLVAISVDTSKSDAEQMEEAISQGATVYSAGTYYRPADPDAYPEDETAEKYAVTGVSNIQPERYYFSIFTPKSNDTNIYHYQFTGSDSFDRIDTEVGEEYLNDGYRPNHITKTNAVVHFYIGDLYENTFSMDVSSRTTDQEMNMSNSYLTVTMTSTIQLKSVPSEVEEGVTGADYDKTRIGVAQNMQSNKDTAAIYQAFLSTYDKKDTTTGSSNVSINLQAPPFVGVNSYNYYLGTEDSGTAYPISYPDPNIDGISENYVTLANNVNIISEISKAANDYAITFKVVYELRYFGDDELAAQFSPNPERKEEIGTKVIGFSNISSSQDGVGYSAASEKDDTTSLRYYVADSSKATLTYNVLKTTNEMLGPYSYLGINPQETNEKEHLIKTVAQYNTESLKDNGDYIEFSIKLHYKYDDYATNLPIGTYFKDLKIYGTNNDVIFDSSWANGYTKSLNDVVYLKSTNTGSEYKVRVHKDYVQKQGGIDSNKYLLPIDYTVYTGDEKFNAEEGGLMYSNYKVSVHAEMWSAVTGGTESDPSNADNYLVYTNARVEPNVIS